jgi:hypothetical protein
MSGWIELASQLEAEGRDDADNDRPASPNVANVANVMGGLPLPVFNGLTRLRSLPAPRRLLTPANWAGVIADAETLVVDGWAAQALRLGWEPIELFGVGPDYDGLAVWLNGRRLSLLDQASAISKAGNARHFFNRRPPAGAVMLWDWGRSR